MVVRCTNREFYSTVNEPTTYPWSSCAAYALGSPNRVITFHPSYLVSRVTHVEPLRITPCGANKTVTGSLAV